MIALILAIIYLIISLDVIMVYKYRLMERYKGALLVFVHLFVLITNIIIFLALAYYYRGTFNSLMFITGIIFVLIGLFYDVWAAVNIKGAAIMKRNKLITTGPYAYSRHPIYSSNIVIALGISIAMNSLYAVIYTIFLFFSIIYLAVQEEKILAKKFGKNYLNYKKRVRFII